MKRRPRNPEPRRGFHLAALALLAVLASSGCRESTPGDAAPGGGIPASEASAILGHWTFDEGVGDDAHDASGHGFDGALMGDAAWAPGRLGTAVELDGDGDFVRVLDLGDGWALDLEGAITVALWVRPERLDGSSMLVSKDNVFELEIQNGVYGVRLNNVPVGKGQSTLAANAWQHAAFTWDPAGGTVSFFYNGRSDGGASFSGNDEGRLDKNQLDVGLGARPAGAFYFAGGLDDVRIYAEALDAAEVAELFARGEAPGAAAPPFRAHGAPRGAQSIGTTEATLRLETNEAATCRYDPAAGTAFDAMSGAFTTTGGTTHAESLSGLAGGIQTFHVRCRDEAGNVNPDDFEISWTILRPTAADFDPTRLDHLEFFVESTFFEDPDNLARSVTTCGDAECIRRWEDRSGYVPSVPFKPPEWVAGRDFGQDDVEKPVLVPDCLNGRPCVRGGPDPVPDNGVDQDISLEIEYDQSFHLPGRFSIFFLARPVAQDSDYHYFGVQGLRHRVLDDSLHYHAGGVSHPLTGPGAVKNGEWQLIEVHRDDRHQMQAVVNSVEVQLKNAAAVGDAAPTNFLSYYKGKMAMYGDVAAILVCGDLLSEQERHDVREYFSGLYGI